MERHLDSAVRARSTAAPLDPWRVARWLTAIGLAALVVLLTDRLVQVQHRLEDIESARLDEALTFRSNLEGVKGDLTGIREELQTTSLEGEELTEELATRLREAEERLGDIGSSIEDQASSLTKLEEERRNFRPEVVEQRLEEVDRTLSTQWESLSAEVVTAKEAASESMAQLERLEATLTSERNLTAMWRELVGPVVQLAGATSVGSGVLLRSERDPQSGSYRTHLLTAWHVVRDIQGDLSKTDMPVPVFIYTEDGSIEERAAKLLVFDADLDAALLVLETDAPLPNGATLADRETLASVRIFEEVYAVGCPLGNDPIPTRGEVATTRHIVDGDAYWMINAPTYIGNSGGGIFDSKTHELLGIFSKIYTHGSLRPTIVPHMGLATPLSAIYDWLETVGHAEVVPGARPAAAEVAAASAELDEAR